MVAAGRNLRQRATMPEFYGRSLLAVAGILPEARGPGKVPAQRRNDVCWSPTITLGAPRFRLANTTR